MLQPQPVWWDQKHPEGHFLAWDIFATGRCHLRERSSNVLRGQIGPGVAAYPVSPGWKDLLSGGWGALTDA